MKIADLFAEVGFKFDSIKLREVTKLIGDLNISSIVGATSLVALGEGIKNLIESTSQLSSNLTTLKTNTGVDNQFTQQFEKAAKAMGSSKEAADGLITSLSKIRQSVKFGGAVPRGLALMGINYQDIMGSEEDLIAKINRLLSQKPQLRTQAQKEAWASFISSINADLGATPDLLKALSNPTLFNTMHKFLTLSENEINANVEATKQWTIAVENVNMELLKTADKLLPTITDLLRKFNDGTGIQTVANTLKGVGDELYKVALAYDIIKNYGKAALLNIGSAASQPLINAAKLGNEIRKDFSTPITTVKIDVAPITVQANDPHEFIKRFDEHFKRYMALTSSQFTIGQT